MCFFFLLSIPSFTILWCHERKCLKKLEEEWSFVLLFFLLLIPSFTFARHPSIRSSSIHFSSIHTCVHRSPISFPTLSSQQLCFSCGVLRRSTSLLPHQYSCRNSPHDQGVYKLLFTLWSWTGRPDCCFQYTLTALAFWQARPSESYLFATPQD